MKTQGKIKSSSSIGTAMALKDGTIIYHVNGEAVGEGPGSVVWRFPVDSPGYADALEHIGGIKPGERKPIPPYTNNCTVFASMKSDKTIRLMLTARLADGSSGEMVLLIKPSDPQYKTTLQQFERAKLKPGSVDGWCVTSE